MDRQNKDAFESMCKWLTSLEIRLFVVLFVCLYKCIHPGMPMQQRQRLKTFLKLLVQQVSQRQRWCDSSYFNMLLWWAAGDGEGKRYLWRKHSQTHTHKYTLTHIGCVYRGTTSTKAFLILQFCPLPPSFTGSFCCSELFLLLCTHLISYIKKIIFSSLLLRGAQINKSLWQMHVSFDASLTHTCDLLPPANMGDSACGLCTVCVTTRMAMCVCVCCSINTVGGMVACAG